MKQKEKLRIAAKIKTQDYKFDPNWSPPLNTATKLFDKPDRKRPFSTLIDKEISPHFTWFLSQTVTWFTVTCSGKSRGIQLS